MGCFRARYIAFGSSHTLSLAAPRHANSIVLRHASHPTKPESLTLSGFHHRDTPYSNRMGRQPSDAGEPTFCEIFSPGTFLVRFGGRRSRNASRKLKYSAFA